MMMNSTAETSRPLPIEETIAEVGSDRPLLNSRLTELSNLSSEEIAPFEHSWAAIEPKRRRQIVHRLVELTEDNVEFNFDRIFKHLLTDPDDEVRSKAIEGLWENEETSLINPLVNLLEQDSSEKVQAAAATALGRFTMLAEHKKLRSHHASRMEEALLAVIGDETKPVEVRHRALEAVAPLSIPQVRTAIMAAYQHHDSSSKVSSIYAMGKNCDPSWLPILLRELASADPEVRYEAAKACGEVEEEEAVPYLIELIDDHDADVQMSAIQSLGKIGGTMAKEYLEQCLSSSNEAISQTAEQALLELGAKEDLLSF
jgi:hypothetical protein